MIRPLRSKVLQASSEYTMTQQTKGSIMVVINVKLDSEKNVSIPWISFLICQLCASGPQCNDYYESASKTETQPTEL
jgi:hypothetical protein